ncbi:protein downy mildew resistance 6 [Quercus suber]|uniref:Protein downy mildew resistance 6 n=1 Tax=Quercus suber TaxID=58331 RepID=A0AAW0LMV8_QUESU
MEIKNSFQMANSIKPLSLTPNFILPEDKRPQLAQISPLASIPIIDLNDHVTSSLLQKISQACEEYGFFQVINHGVSEELCEIVMTAVTQFFELSPKERAEFFTEDITKQVRLFNYYLKSEGQEKVTMWSEIEAFVEYAKEVDTLMHRLFRLISQGLGLDKDCLQKRMGDKPRLRAQANFYPPCPDPELTLGLAVHTDLNALTVLQQSAGVTGLQVIKDGKWVAVDPIPNAFVINLGDQIQVLSNGRFKSVHHRAVTNKTHPRVSLAMFYGPNTEDVIGPIEDLIDDEHPPVYRRYRYAEFLEKFYSQEGTRRMVKELFELPK